MKAREIIPFFKDIFKAWSEDKVQRMAAAISYFTIFSIAPLLIIAIAIAGLVFGQEAAQNQIVGQIQGLIGQGGAQAIQSMIAGARKPSSSIFAAVIGVIVLLFSAAGLFGQLQDALNTIWEVAPKPGKGIWTTVKERFLSFAMVLGIGFLLLVSLVVSAALSALGTFAAGLLPGFTQLMQIVNFVISIAVITLLFALIFKVLPDVIIDWKDVWLGALVTATLFTIGKYLIGLYLGRSSYTSTYGAAGSLVIIMVWVYYSGLILFFGVEFTKVYARKFGKKIIPAPGAVILTEMARAQQGIPHRSTLEEAAKKKNEDKDQAGTA